MSAPADQRNERALQAMADAVERSRRGAAAASLQDRAGDRPPPLVESPPPEAPPRAAPSREEEPLERRLRWGIVAAAFLVAAVLVAALLTHGSNGPSRATSGSSGASTSTGSHRTNAAAPSTSAPSGSGGSNSTSTSTTTSTTAPPAGSRPQVTSIGPDSGTAGQQVTLSGSGLISTDGQVQALFDGQAAATTCPAQDTCTVTVPDLPGPARPVAVTVVTSAGASAPVNFSYGGNGAPALGAIAGPSAGGGSAEADGSHHGSGGHHRGD